MATAGGVLFAASGEGNLLALDAATGKELWRYASNGSMAASPMSFAVDGHQYVAVAAAGALHCFGLE
jgi:alcohol dehydrogenase (cytochrome c)